MSHRHGRTDSNQTELVDVWRCAGAWVEILSDVGGGSPDTLVVYKGKKHYVEIKTKNGTLTPKEKEYHRKYKAVTGEEIPIVRNKNAALLLLGICLPFDVPAPAHLTFDPQR